MREAGRGAVGGMGCAGGASGSHLPHERACFEKSHWKGGLGRSSGSGVLPVAGEEGATLGLKEGAVPKSD